MNLEQILGNVTRRVNAYAADVQRNWKEYSFGTTKRVNQIVNDVKATVQLVPNYEKL